MSTGARAWVSVAMLAGFLVVAGLQLALVVVPVLILLAMLPGNAALQIGGPLCVATVGVMAHATWRALRTRRAEPAGIPVSRADAPHLWSMLDAAAAVAGVRAPDAVIVVAEAVATLHERTRLLGLIPGRRTLYLGIPLLEAWDPARLRAIVAHELAHGTPRLSRIAPMAYRGRVAIGRVVPRIPRRNPAGPLLRAWGTLYRRVDAPFSHAQELTADRVAAEFAGVPAATAVLRDRPAIEAVLRIFHAEYVSPGWRAGHVPDDLFGGFLRVLAARADEMAVLRAREPAPPGPWDTHPSRTERLAAMADSATPRAKVPRPGIAAQGGSAAQREMAAQPAMSGPGGTVAQDESVPQPGAGAPAGMSVRLGTGDAGGTAAQPGRGAARSGIAPGSGAAADVELVPDLPGLGRALQAVVFPPQGRTVVGWDEFFGAARTIEMEREADAALGKISRAAGTTVTTPGEVLDLAADGRLRKAAETVFPDLAPDETAARIGELVTLLLALAALRSGVGRWRHSWTGTAELVTRAGGHLDLGGLAAQAIDPATVGAARERLAALGIDLTATVDDSSVRGAAHADVVGGLVNLVVDGSRTDMLIVDTGLLLVPGLPRSQNGSAKRRLAQLAAAGVPGDTARFVPYADVAGAAQTRRAPKSWDLRLRDGGTMTVRTALDSDELPGGWAALDDAVAFLARTRS